jgi:hypothetical protein
MVNSKSGFTTYPVFAALSGCVGHGGAQDRWEVEHTFAWLEHLRRLVARWERYSTTYIAFFHVAYLLITLKKL